MSTREGADLLLYLPHRYENVLIDTVTLESPEVGSLTITIPKEDPLGRELFLKEKKPGQFVLISPVMMEILALGSIVSRNVVVSNETVVFASISNFEKFSDFESNSCVQGRVTLSSNKGGFLRYKGELFGTSPVCKGDMLAFFTTGALQDSLEGTVPLSFVDSSPIEKPAFKSAWMHCADQLCAITETSITTRYTYPDNHPLVRGHFPGNPLMMGVMQWMSVEDAFLVFCKSHGLRGERRFMCDATLIKENGVVVSDIKSIQVTTWLHHDDYIDQADITATKKIAFRTAVRPGETLYTRIESITPA